MTDVKYIELLNELDRMKKIIANVESEIENNHDLNVIVEIENLIGKSSDVKDEAKIIFGKRMHMTD